TDFDAGEAGRRKDSGMRVLVSYNAEGRAERVFLSTVMNDKRRDILKRYGEGDYLAIDLNNSRPLREAVEERLKGTALSFAIIMRVEQLIETIRTQPAPAAAESEAGLEMK